MSLMWRIGCLSCPTLHTRLPHAARPETCIANLTRGCQPACCSPTFTHATTNPSHISSPQHLQAANAQLLPTQSAPLRPTPPSLPTATHPLLPAQEALPASMATGMSSKRLQKELSKIHGVLPPGITLVSAPDLRSWEMDICILDNPLYPPTDIYRLKLSFSPSYPIEAPEVVFVALASPERKIPLHPHIYSNGIICLDLLDSAGWSPVHNVESICISIQSMLAGNTKAEREWHSTLRVNLGMANDVGRASWRCGVRSLQPPAASGHQLPVP